MGMTIRVYDVDSKTGTVVRERTSVTTRSGKVGDVPPMFSSAYPLCQCSRCRVRSSNR